MNKQKGFSLIELLIVVVIIGIIAAIAIPNLLAARRSANEGGAISALRTYHGAQATYASTYGNGDYAGAWGVVDSFPVLGSVGVIDSVLASRQKSGYFYGAAASPRTATAPACHLAQAIPLSMSGVTQTGTRHFMIATEGVINATPIGAGMSYTTPTCAITGGTVLNN